MRFPLLLAMFFGGLAGSAGAAVQEPERQRLRIEPLPTRIAMVDLNRDGGKEVLSIAGASIELILGIEAGENQSKQALIPGESTLWTVADHDHDQQQDFLVLVDGKRLLRLEWDEAGLQWSEPLIEDLRAVVPRGVRAADFAKDLDGDGWIDLALPLGGRIKLYFGGEQGFRPGPDLGVVSQLLLNNRGGGRNLRNREGGLLGRVSRRLIVPRIQMKDVTGDDLPDLMVNEGQKIRQYVHGEEDLPREPTVTIDLEKYLDRLPEMSLDPGNIFRVWKSTVWEEWGDLNLDGAQDLILLWGDKVLIYLGGPNGINLRAPRDQVRANGNVLYALAARVDRDEIPDLVFLRIENVSLARALSWLVFSFSLKIDILAYKGIGNGRFQRQPMPQSKIGLEIDSPSVLKLIQQKDDGDALRRTVVRVADLDGDGRRTDLVMLDSEGVLTGWRDLVRDRSFLNQVTAAFFLDLLRSKNDIQLDIETLFGWIFGRASLLVSLTRGKQPSFRMEPPQGWAPPQAMTVNDLDGDGRDEVLMLRRFIPAPGQKESEGPARLVGYVVDPN